MGAMIGPCDVVSRARQALVECPTPGWIAARAPKQWAWHGSVERERQRPSPDRVVPLQRRRMVLPLAAWEELSAVKPRDVVASWLVVLPPGSLQVLVAHHGVEWVVSC